MKVYELMRAGESLLSKLKEANVNVDDSQYISMHSDYRRLKSEGHKIAYITAYLSNIYNISERNIYRIVDKFEQEI